MNYILYVITGCPHCQKVLDFAKENDINLEIRNISESREYESELVDKGGKRQCPFLVDGETMMYESDDIVAHLKSKM